MAYQIIVTYKAERDLENIRDFIARDNPGIAEAFCSELLQEAASLSIFPNREGTLAKRPNIRKLPYRSYLIFYKIDEEERTVEILRFWHAARDQKRLRLQEEQAEYNASIPQSTVPSPAFVSQP